MNTTHPEIIYSLSLVDEILKNKPVSKSFIWVCYRPIENTTLVSIKERDKYFKDFQDHVKAQAEAISAEYRISYFPPFDLSICEYFDQHAKIKDYYEKCTPYGNLNVERFDAGPKPLKNPYRNWGFQPTRPVLYDRFRALILNSRDGVIEMLDGLGYRQHSEPGHSDLRLFNRDVIAYRSKSIN